jgi:hypothetical protein
MITWYLNRLKTISIAEFPYRIKQFIKTNYERYFSQGKFPARLGVATNGKMLIFPSGTDKIYPDSIQVFGRNFKYTAGNINWHEDIFTGECFPLSFSKALNIRGNSGLSAKNVWEMNRLQFLTFVALNYRNTGSGVYLNQFTGILTSWIDNNPYLTGINWYSNIEINIRLIIFFFCWQFLDADELIQSNHEFKEFAETKWMPSIFQHCQYSFSNPSKYSSSNNHLISEYAGLFIASSLWQFNESGYWNSYSKKGLEKEILRQHSENGINKEEAAEYIQFITDFFLTAWIIGEKSANPFSSAYKNKLKEVLYYIYSFLDCKGNFPQYGDEDDGKCFIFDNSENFNNFRSLLTSGAIIFRDPMLKSGSNGFDLKNQLLFGESGRVIFNSIPDINYIRSTKFFTEEGHFIFRKQENGGEIYLHFDAAPLGYLSIAAHGHADALAFILHVDGHPVFIDSGTYVYHTEPEWRQYFIGTLAHNTISVDHKNQAVNGGPTLWIKHYKTSILDHDSDGNIERIKATHNGYNKENAQHIRELAFDRINNEFHILDTIVVRRKRKISVEIPFHIHPSVDVTFKDDNCYHLSAKNVRNTELIIDEKLDPVIVKGQTEPKILGWYSGSFLKKEATKVIYCKTHIESTTSFKFVIKII